MEDWCSVLAAPPGGFWRLCEGITTHGIRTRIQYYMCHSDRSAFVSCLIQYRAHGCLSVNTHCTVCWSMCIGQSSDLWLTNLISTCIWIWYILLFVKKLSLIKLNSDQGLPSFFVINCVRTNKNLNYWWYSICIHKFKTNLTKYLKRKNTHVHTENQFTAEVDTETLQGFTSHFLFTDSYIEL